MREQNCKFCYGNFLDSDFVALLSLHNLYDSGMCKLNLNAFVSMEDSTIGHPPYSPWIQLHLFVFTLSFRDSLYISIATYRYYKTFIGEINLHGILVGILLVKTLIDESWFHCQCRWWYQLSHFCQADPLWH
jgi:hypothetical protein